ncbi:hypothetical protein DFJ74DRAFT_532827 [Hyaloraphidium curvatum]|nr:hypothetical protein DFJ74DRAFT_532827 [Hyaloraphidium curvatum]
MFASLPAVDELYYVLGFYTTQVPGVEYPEDAPNMQIAAAMNPCRNEYLFAFAGVETTVLWPEPPINITVSLDLAGFALDGTVTSDALGIVSEFWTPHGTRSVVVSGQTYFQGTASITLDLEPVALTFASSGIVLLDSDPRRNGLARVDVALAVQVSAAPSASLLDGMVEMDLSGLATATCATVVRYLTPSDWEFALQTSLTSDLGDFFQAMPQIGDLLADPIDQIFGGVRVSGQLDIYASPAGWGFRVCLDGTGALPQLGVAWKILTMYIPSLPSRIDACFSVGGPFSGTGFPIVATFRALGKPLSLYFCRRDWDCPGDHRCNSGLCATFGCPASYPNLQGILCYGSCRAGYTNVLGICWQNCPSRWTDLGVTCARDSDDPCPSGQEKQGGLCYPRCRSGFDGIGPVCWERCDDDYMDLGALCFRPAATRRKRCGCCHVRLRCRRWRCRWRKSCCDSCDDGFRDTGCTCFRGARTYAKKTYVRSPSSPIIFKDAYTIPGVLPRVAVAGLNW